MMSELAVCQRRLEAEMLLVRNVVPLSTEDDSRVLEGMRVRGLGVRWAGPARAQLGQALQLRARYIMAGLLL